MSLRTATIAISAGRATLGLGLMVIPERIAARWVGPDGADPPAATLARSVGVRDVALGIGAMVALTRDGDSAPAWLVAAAVSDVGDMAGVLVERESLPAGGVRGTLALAGASALCATLMATRR